ncbi:MAG: hypothetical protein K0Q49_772 [Haloplasmataceae bacterium]|jgi:hypothetical protein|nr:hypothetical protein [Haloplasmataceae bacterium]
MSLNYLKEAILKSIHFVKKGYKDLYALYLYKLFLVFGFFILIHQKFTFELRINKKNLADIDLLTLIEDWQILVFILVAIPVLLFINVFTIRASEDQFNVSKHSTKYSLTNFGKYIFVFLTYYIIVIILTNWLVQALASESLFLKIFLGILLIGSLLFLFTFLRFLPTKTLVTGSIIKSIQEIYVTVKTNLVGSFILLFVSIGLFALFETLITVLELNGALIYESMMHLKVLLFILLIIVMILKAAVSYFIYLVDIHFIINLNPVRPVTNNKK